jgi:hypothetical protein
MGKIRLAISSISFYRENGDSVFVITTTGHTLKSKEHTIVELDMALAESYNYIKQIPKVNSNETN